MSATLDQTIEVKQYFRMFWRRRALVVLCTVTVFCTALVGFEFVPVEYKSIASLIINERQRVSSQLEKLMGGMGQSGGGGWGYEEKQMAELVSRVRSQPFLERVARLLKMNEDPTVLKQARAAAAGRTDVSVEELATRIAVGKLRGKISFAGGGSGIYQVVVSDSSPANAQLLARWISELFVDTSAQTSLEQLKRAHEFGAEQLKIYEQQLVRSEQALEQYRQGQIEQNLDRGVVRANNVALAEALYRRVNDEVELARLRVLPFSRALAGAGLDATQAKLLDDPDVQGQAVALAAALKDAATDRLVSTQTTLGDWPPAGSYVSLRRSLFQTVERKTAVMLGDQSRDVQDQMTRLVFMTLDHRAHSATATFLGDAISGFKEQAQSEPRGELDLARLQAEVATNRELLSSFRAQLVASDIGQAVATTDLGPRIEILDPPQVPLYPSSPNRMMVLAAAVALGLVLGLGVALATELMDSTLRSLPDFERVFKGPVLGTTPLLISVPQQPARLRRYWVPATLTAVVLVTALFFVTRDTVLRGLGATGDSIHLVDPQESATR